MASEQELRRRLEIVEKSLREWANRDERNHASIEPIRTPAFTDPSGAMYGAQNLWAGVRLTAAVRNREGVEWWSAQMTLTAGWLSRTPESDVRYCVRKFLRRPVLSHAEWL